MSTSDNANTSRFKFRLQSPTPVRPNVSLPAISFDIIGYCLPAFANRSRKIRQPPAQIRQRDKDKDKDSSLVCEATRDTIHQVLLTYCPREETHGLEGIADVLAQVYELMHEKDFTVFATSTLEKKMSKAERKRTKPLHLVAIMLAELKDGTDAIRVRTFVDLPKLVRVNGKEGDVEDVSEDEEEEEEERKRRTRTKPSSGHHSSGVRPPVSVRVKIEGLSAPLANKPSKKPAGPSSSEPLSTSLLSTINAEIQSRHRGVDWKAVTSDHTTPTRKHRIRFITVYCHELHKVKALPNPNVLVPAVWTSMNGDLLILYSVRSAQAIKGADPHRVWYFKDGWKNITKAWNEGLDEAHIAHPDQIGMCIISLPKMLPITLPRAHHKGIPLNNAPFDRRLCCSCPKRFDARHSSIDVNKIDQLNSHLADKEEEVMAYSYTNETAQAQLDGVRRTLIESEEENDILRRTNLDKEATIQDLTTAQRVVSAEVSIHFRWLVCLNTQHVADRERTEGGCRETHGEGERVVENAAGYVADLEKKVRLHTAQRSDGYYNPFNHEKCKDNAKEIAHLNDVAHAQEKELKGYDEEILKVRDARDKAKKELTNLNMKLSRAEDEVQLAQSQVRPQINYDWHIVDNTVAGKIIGKGLGGIEDQGEGITLGDYGLVWGNYLTATGGPRHLRGSCAWEGDGRLSEGGSRLKRPWAGMTTRSSLPIATRSRPQLAVPPAAPAALPLELAVPAVPASELAAPPPSDHDIDNLFTVDMLKEAITAMGAKPLVGKSIRKAHLQQQAKDEAQKKRNLQE
ncbi:hypothetical protein IMY05_C4612000200 [Salix suchowensis]|nr:hypothetical protein IMY05_C4612000200 [Salix suchowensis]